MKILLINPPTTFSQIYGDWDLSALDTYSPPLGILHIASYLRENNHDPFVLDLESLKWNFDKLLAYTSSLTPDLIGITSMTINFMNAQKVASLMKANFQSVPVIIGGTHITAAPMETMSKYPEFDYGVYGEGEITFLEMVEKIKIKDPVTNVKGLIWRNEEDQIIINEPRPYIENLDMLPFPAWDLLENFPARYPLSILESKRLPAASIMTSRGCPFHCTFCDNKLFGTKVRHFSSEYTINMINHLIDNHGIKDLMILDDNFILNRDKLFEICDSMINNKLDLTWYCMGHANTMTEDRLGKIKEAGCWFIELGIESGNDEMLKKIRKSTTKKEIIQAVSLAKKAGLKTKGNFIFGFPGETLKTLEETTRFAIDSKIDFFQQNFLTIWPGCEIYSLINNNSDSYEYYNSSWDTLAHQRITFIPKNMSKNELIKASNSAFRRFYLRPRVIIGLLPLITSKRGVKFLYSALGTFLRTILRNSKN
jgi:anaerobic magnesium-protoporphyrin IX monomethyl ester cyclase